MKVKINNYPNRLVCKIHTRHMHKKYGFLEWSENIGHVDYVLEAIENGVQGVYNVFNWIWYDRRTQKVKVRIDRWDTWSMDSTLAHIILPMLKQLQETKQGAPNVDDEDVPEELASTSSEPKENAWDTDSNHFKRWDWVLDEMIWAFNQKSRDYWEGDYYKYRELSPEEDKGDSLFGIKLVWEDKEGRAAHQQRMTNGFKLFGKYMENLWD